MPDGMYRIGIVGAGSLLGKELADELQDSLLAASDFLLFDDDEEATGQLAAAGDEAAVLQQVQPDSFARLDFLFFAGDQESTRKHWPAARKSGASIVDLSGALEGEAGVPVRAPWISAGASGGPDLGTPAVVAAHPAAVLLALAAARVHRVLPVRSLAATVVEPASQHGREAMDELHQQTVNLLSFQSLPREHYDAQVAFNVLPALGEGAKVNLLKVEEEIVRHYGFVGAGKLPRLDLELVQAPVFHGYVASILIELDTPTSVHQLEQVLTGDQVDLVSADSEPPSNLSSAGQQDILLRVRATTSNTRYWIWAAADNLKLAALNGIACANELRRLRPRGKVQ